jgi:hypothetical protein
VESTQSESRNKLRRINDLSHLDTAVPPVRFLELKESPMGIVSTLGRHAFVAEP